MISIAVIGGGAAGLMAAGTAKELGTDVTLFEKNQKFGRKLAITGKGRCNITNNCSVSDFLSNVVTNPRFLYSCLSAFTPQDTIDFFESRGVKLKTERGNRVFPQSDSAYDVVDVLGSYSSKCRIVRDKVIDISKTDESDFCIKTQSNSYNFDKVIICTGGMSYPLTGSDGDGYRFAKSFGHTIIPPKASLVPLEIFETWCVMLQGLSLKNVALKVTFDGEIEYSDFGEMLFTHFGVSGPIILSASSHMKKEPIDNYRFSIDLKPALDLNTLDKRILSDFEKYRQRNFDNALDDLLPSKLIPVIISLSGIEPKKKVYEITKTERVSFAELLKNFKLTPVRLRPIEEAIITSGGVCVNEINPKTMQSKLVPGLYFAGEILDTDACTGGFNLQIAFSSAKSAALGAASD